MTSVEFTEWPKTTRLFRDILVTEKIDGYNSAIRIENLLTVDTETNSPIAMVQGEHDDVFGVWAQSRKRLITPGDDNFGFARWVSENAGELMPLLGEGIHFGEWWGSGIQRGYGLTKGEKRFSLFNTERHKDIEGYTDLVHRVPVLYEGVFSQQAIEDCLFDLKENGSMAAPGFMNPEGICVFHSQSRVVQKVTLDHNDKMKWEAEEISA